MRSAPRSVAALAIAVGLVAGGCKGSGGESAVPPRTSSSSTSSSSSSTSTSTSSTSSTTTTAETTTTTAAAVQGLAASDAKAVISPAGIVVPVLGRDGDALLVGTPCGRSAPLRTGTPVKDTVVVIDAGHGGVEPGAVGPAGLTEKALNLNVASFAEKALDAAGHPALQTRSGDYRITLDARAKIVSTVKPRAFVSIHHNAEPDGPRDGPGTETYYQTVGSTAAESKRLAGLIYEEVVRALSQYQGVAWAADRDAGAKYRKNARGDDYYGIVRRTQGTPGVLAELGFIANAPEEALYARADVQQVEGEAVARGVIRFLTTNDPGSGFVEPYPRETPAGGGGGSDNCVDPPLS